MPIKLGDVAPNFTAETTMGTIDFHTFLGSSWGILFTHPADFTPVCTTELGSVAALIDSLQLTANYSVATPANWKNGEDCIIVPAVKDEEIPHKFPKGYKVVKPYLRTTPQPN